MSEQEHDKPGDKPTTPGTLTDQDIKTTRLNGRRLFLGMLGITALGATAVVLGHNSSSGAKAADNDANDSKKHHDFPKKSNDSDTTHNKDLKAVDSDDRNSKAVDADQNRLRDAKGSSDSD